MTEDPPPFVERFDGDSLVQSLIQAGLDVRPIQQALHANSGKLHDAVNVARRPILFPGLADHWPARKNWTPDSLSEAHGHKTVTALMCLPPTGILLPRDQHDYERQLPLADFFSAMETASTANPCYLAYTRPDGLFPEEDYDFSALTPRSKHRTDTRIWVGSTGTRSALHSDLKDNLFCQIWGRKLVILMSWDQSRAAYPFPDNLVNSQIDLTDPDLTRFPRLRSAILYAGVVHPGDILFIPRGCWHDFTSLTPSISINHWFGPSIKARRYAALLLRLGHRYWASTARDFLIHGVLRRPEKTVFFFSPPSTGKRLYNLVRWGDFSRDNDPAAKNSRREINSRES